MSHTPGPWKAHNFNTVDHIDIDAGCERICSISLDTSSIYFNHGDTADTPANEIQRRWANARLIAAAPELLETLKGLLAFYGEDDNEWIDQTRDVITKATGEEL